MPNEKIAYTSLIVTGAGPDILKIQQDLVAVVKGTAVILKKTRLDAQQSLVDQVPIVQTAITSRVQTIKETKATNISNITKDTSLNRNQKIQAKKVQSNLARRDTHIARHGLADPIVKGFETAYVDTRLTKNEMLAKIDKYGKGLESGYAIVQASTNPGVVQIKVSGGTATAAVPVLELMFGDARFNATSDPQVFQHKTNGRDYVKDRNGFYVSRYVIRNLSSSEKGTIKTATPPLTAQVSKVPSDTELYDEIMAHVRSKEKSGGTCFISFTHTKHNVVGSTGALFYNPDNGDVIVDLSKVPVQQRVDLHSFEAVKQIFGIDNIDINMAFDKASEDYQKNAAARDTVRTREILVAKEVPAAGVVALRVPTTTTAKPAWQTLTGTNAVLPAGIPAEWST